MAPAAGTAAASRDPAPVEQATTSDDPSPEPGPPVEQAATSDTPPPEIDQGIELAQEPAPILVEFGQESFWSSESLTVLSTGEATVRSLRSVLSNGNVLPTASFTLSRSKLAQLSSALEQARFGSLRSSYVLSRYQDAAGTRSATTGGP